MMKLAQKLALPSLAVLIGVTSFFATSCSKQEGAQAQSAPVSDIPTVAVARTASENLTHDLILTAEFRPFQEIDVMAKVAGYIREINVDVGDHVKENQLLATLEIPEMGDDLRRADASVQRSQADVQHAKDEIQRSQAARDIAQLSFNRLTEVSKKRPGLVAQQEIDDAQSKYLVADAQVSAANSALAAAGQQVAVNNSDVARVKTLMDYTRVTAPFAGVITKRYADKGSMIQAGTASQTQAMPVVRLSENSLLRLILPVPESSVSTVHIGQQVAVRVPTLNRSFPGKVARFSDKLALATRTMDTEVDVQNPSLILIPGMYAEVDLSLARRTGVLAIPVTAVDADNDNSATNGTHGTSTSGQVMVITPNNRVEVRKIALGLETANRVEVLSGLNEGDMVVIGGRAALQPGMEVHPKVTSMVAAKQ
ncbi:MAG TPA: efflux RND transporter periplasmic adaptor subunit [Candidatus Acidoferrales bacterium]|jgi:RND family efflux transporter MFP subunit|nr:efflux RND transporter periplasmic adaptor subunit [Candidatus Acidoferrales bacterium]